MVCDYDRMIADAGESLESESESSMMIRGEVVASRAVHVVLTSEEFSPEIMSGRDRRGVRTERQARIDYAPS